MNERIKELAEQADLVRILNEHAHEYGNGQFENTPYPELEKFAQLIIRECMDVVRDINQDYDGGSTTVNAAEEIAEHFGVSE